MPDNTINIKIEGDSSGAAAAFQQGVAGGQQFAAAIEKLTPTLGEGRSAETAFTGALQQLSGVIGNFQSGLSAIPDQIEKVAESFHHASGAAHETSDAIDKASHSADMREMQLSIREGIENPLRAARLAAEAFFLSFGETGLAATATLAIGIAAFEATQHVEELSHQYTLLAGQLGIGVGAAQQLSRAFKLAGLDTSALYMANRTLSTVLSSGSEASRKLRDELEVQGVKLRDQVTGQYLPFNEIMVDIVTTLSKATATFNANRLGAEALGRTYLELSGVAKELPGIMASAKGGLSTEDIELANKYELGWGKIKLKIDDAADSVGLWLIKLDQAAVALDKMAGTSLPAAGEEGHKPTTYISKTMERLGSKGPSLTPPAPAVSASQFSNAKEVAAGTAAAQNALRPLGGETSELEKKFEDLQKEIGVYNKNSLDTVTTSGKTLGALIAESNAIRGQIEAIKARGAVLSSNEDAVKNSAKNATAGVEFDKRAFEDRIKVAQIGLGELEKLDLTQAQAHAALKIQYARQELAIEQDSIAKQIAFQKTALAQAPDEEKRVTAAKEIAGLNQKGIEATQKFKDAELAANTEVAEDQAKLVIAQQKADTERFDAHLQFVQEMEKLEDDWSKSQMARMNEVADASRKAQETQAKDALESTRKQLEDSKDTKLKQISDSTSNNGDFAAVSGYQQRRSAIQAYDVDILQTIKDLGALAVAEGRAADLASNKKYLDAQVKSGAISQGRADLQLSTGTGPGMTHAAEDAAQAQATKSTTDFINTERKTLAELDADFQKNVGTQFFSKLNTGFQGAIQSWVSGTKTFGKAWTQMGTKMVTDWITNLATIGIKFAETELKNLVIHQFTQQAQVASTVAGGAASNAAQATFTIKSILMSAKQAYASVSANPGINSIPFIGPALAQAAGVAAFAGIMALAAFEQGGIVGGSQQLALLHPHEMVLPSKISQSVQDMASGGGGGASGGNGGGGGGDSHVHYHAAPNESPDSIRKNSAEILKVVRKGLRSGKLSPA